MRTYKIHFILFNRPAHFAQALSLAPITTAAVEKTMKALEQLLSQTAARHRHLCPRQVLGVRIGMLGAHLLELDLPQADKRVFTFMETDGCAADGVSVATGCSVGRRTLRVVDYGRVAATLVDTQTDRAFRLHPHPAARQRAVVLFPDADRWHAQRQAYQQLPDDELLVARAVVLNLDLKAIISRPGVRTVCGACGEEVINEREVEIGGRVLCRACAEGAYYRSLGGQRGGSES